MPYCKALYNHISVLASGDIKPCCFYKNPKRFNIHETTPYEYLHGTYLENIRNNMKIGWDPGCEICKNDIEAGRFSMMESINLASDAEQFVIDSIEITPSNTCNFRCRTCSPIASSKWAETLGKKIKFKKNNIRTVLDNLDLSRIKTIKFMGGEPFITSELSELVDLIYDSGNHNLTLHTSTNLSLFPKKMLKSITKIKNFMLVVSIDGTGRLNDYIRHDSDWETTVKNLELWLEFLRNNMPFYKIYMHTVVQAYNFHNLKDIKIFADQYNIFHSTQLIDDPVEFSLNSLPPEYIETHKTDYTLKFLNNYNFDKNGLRLLKNKTELQDAMLGKNIIDYIPELHALFDKYSKGEP
jgi:uncharacterized radical SAM superfamily Fe-S cluster-containing enzyme